MNELRTVFALSTWAFCDFLELSMDRAGTESADAHAGSAKFGPERFREARDVRFGCGVNREGWDRKKTRRGADIQNAAAFSRDHLWKQMASEGSKGHHVYEHHLLVTNRIARREGTEIAESRIVD